jgi:hypothetical protein
MHGIIWMGLGQSLGCLGFYFPSQGFQNFLCFDGVTEDCLPFLQVYPHMSGDTMYS